MSDFTTPFGFTHWKRDAWINVKGFSSPEPFAEELFVVATLNAIYVIMIYPKYCRYWKIVSGTKVNIYPPIKNKKVNPSQIPQKWEKDFFLPNLILDAISIELLGPGVIEVTKANMKNSNTRKL